MASSFACAPRASLTRVLPYVWTTVIPQLHYLATNSDATGGGHAIGSPSAVASSVFTAVGLVGLPLAIATVYTEALLARPGPQRPVVALVRFGLSLVVWEALFSAILHALMLPVVYSSEHVTLATLPAYVANSTRCLMAVSPDQESLPSDEGSPCRGIGLVFAALATTEAASRLAAYAMIRSSSAGSFVVVSTLLWPAVQLISAWPFAMGRAVASPGWHFCGHDAETPDYPCIIPLGPFDVASLGVCAVAVAIWCKSAPRQGRQQDEHAAGGVFSRTSSEARNDDSDMSDEDATFDDVALEVVGLHRQGVYILVMLIVLVLAVCVGTVVAWVGLVTRAIGCLFRESHSRCSQTELLESCVLALLPIALVGSVVLLRWQLKRRGARRRQEACNAAGAVTATLHVYGVFPQSSPNSSLAAELCSMFIN